MNITKLTIIVIIMITIAACASSKKGVSSAVTPTPAASVNHSTSSGNYLFVKPADGIHSPGNEELAAIQVQYKEITIDQLKEGHAIYTGITCIRCHEAKSIYTMETAQWKNILDDMAIKANISDFQKDAVYKYVLAIKATQPK